MQLLCDFYIVLFTLFFIVFLKILFCFFAGFRKSRTFALAKREQLLQIGGVGFPTQKKKEFFERFS